MDGNNQFITLERCRFFSSISVYRVESVPCPKVPHHHVDFRRKATFHRSLFRPPGSIQPDSPWLVCLSVGWLVRLLVGLS